MSRLLVAFMLGWWARRAITNTWRSMLEAEEVRRYRAALGEAHGLAIGHLLGKKL